jgi:small subunit ribosomal protein S20
MANHISAKKRIRRNASRAAINVARRTRIRGFVKKIETAIAAGDVRAAEESLKAARPELDRGVAKGILDKKAASRKISRLSTRIKALKKSS